MALGGATAAASPLAREGAEKGAEKGAAKGAEKGVVAEVGKGVVWETRSLQCKTLK